MITVLTKCVVTSSQSYQNYSIENFKYIGPKKETLVMKNNADHFNRNFAFFSKYSSKEQSLSRDQK